MSQMYLLPSLDLLLIAGRAVALLVAFAMFAWAFRHWRRAATRDTQRVFEQLDLVRSELLIMREVMHGTTRKASISADVELRNASKVERRIETRTPAMANGGFVRGYEIAARLARGGAQQEELMKSCGVTTHEADLLVKLHGRKNAQQSHVANDSISLNQKSFAAANRAVQTTQSLNAGSLPVAASTEEKNKAMVSGRAAQGGNPVTQQRVSQQSGTQPIVKAPASATRPQPSPAPQFRARSRLMAVG